MVLVHRVGGIEDGRGLGDGLDVLDPVVAVIAFVPVFFVCEELCDGFHDRFLSVSIIGFLHLEWIQECLARGLWSGPMIWDWVLLCIFWG